MKTKKKQTQKTKQVKRQIDTGVLHRTFTLNREQVDEENRTVPLAFSSEEPVERWFGNEVLSHDPSHVDLGRLNDGGALLVDHDPRDHVGVIEEASVDSDKVGRAIVRFGQGTRAQEIFQDVLDGIRSKISVGYRIHEMLEDRDTDTYTATRWSPHEISFVSIPADATVGVGRSQREAGEKFETTVLSEEIVEPIQEERTMKTAEEIAAAKAEQKAVREQVRKDELARTKEIRALGKEHGQTESADTAIESGTSIEDYRVDVLNCLRDTPAAPAPKAEIGLTLQESRSFSMLRALNALANPNDKRAQEAAAFEIECSNAVASSRGINTAGFFVPENGMNGFVDSRGMGMTTGGIAVPYEVQNAKRDLSAGTATDGAELVAENLLSGSFIDVLRNLSVVASMGATMLTDLVGDVAIPRKTSGSAAGWISTEGGNAAQSDPQFDQVTLTPKTAGVYTEVTRQLLKQSSIDVESLLRQDLAAGMATLLDLAALYGTGASGQPTGVLNQTGVLTPTAFAGVNPTYAEVVAMETAVADVNALMNSLGYILTTNMRGALKTTDKFSGSGNAVWEKGNRLNDNPTGVSNQLTAGDMFYGNWADLLIGAWGNLDLLIDPYSNSLSGTVRVVAHQSIDIAVRHGESFAFNNDT